MRQSHYLRRLGQTGTAGLLTAALAATAAQAALPTGGMLLPRPRGPARTDLPTPTSISVYRVPSETAYGLDGETHPLGNEQFATQGDPSARSHQPATAHVNAAERSQFATAAAAPAGTGANAADRPLIRPRVDFSDARQAFSEPTPTGLDASPHAMGLEASVAANTLPDGWTDPPATSDLPVNSYAGLKGICPVTLRDERRVVAPRPEYFVEYEGRRYEFATGQARAAFESNPELYAPVLGGRDVVLTASGAEDAVGSLKHAGFYRQRLYLFQSDDTCETFYENPRRYVIGE